MFYPDLGQKCQVDHGPHVRAVGWLSIDHPYTQGSVPSEFLDALRAHLKGQWQPILAAGFHTCDLCPSWVKPGRGVYNVWIPAESVLYVAPEMIRHYIEEHDYQPPAEFVEAVLACPPQNSPEFFNRLRRFDSHWLKYLPKQ